MTHLSNRTIGHVKVALFLVCLTPLLQLVAAGGNNMLGADPIETITRTTGSWALRLLLITLAITPLRKWTGCQWLARLRRIVGLYSFFYACLHFLTYLVFDQYFDWEGIGKDVVKRPYITVGFVSFVLLVPLAVTSTHGMMKRLGGRNWQRLHRLVYLIAAGGVMHYLWLVKRDISGPATYAAILALLLCARLVGRPRKHSLPERLSKPSLSQSARI